MSNLKEKDQSYILEYNIKMDHREM